jgi:predicted nuclease of predicted toxin-antitoxin system
VSVAPRLLFDDNLSNRLPQRLASTYPDSLHAASTVTRGASDDAIWEQARAGGFVLVTKDEDFQRMSVLRGAPPKVLWICLGNCTTDDIADLLEKNVEVVTAFIDHPEATFLALGGR